jgi:hypothetical protein
MAVAAGVVGDLGVLTGVTAQHMPTQRRTAALLNGRHHQEELPDPRFQFGVQVSLPLIAMVKVEKVPLERSRSEAL